MKKEVFIIGLLAVVVLISGCVTQPKGDFSGIKAAVYKSPTCGCCVGYIAFLEQKGFDVETIEIQDLRPIKQKYDIPRSMESCHTTVIGGYFIEGHVPIEAVKKLLQEKPKIDGIALPGMPAGTPGMPGMKKEPYNIYAINNGEISDFIQV